jgi:ATP-dependent Clp protease ATP-binding subunit ClpC
VLLGLLGEQSGKVRRILETLGVHRESVRAEIEKSVGASPESHTSRPAVYTPRAQKAFQLAIREARIAHAIHAEPEHLLLGLLDEGDGLAAKVLNRLGVNAAKAREQIRKQTANGTDDHE